VVNSLIIIEPWRCHYEVLPSVIDSSSHLYDSFVILSEDVESCTNAISFMQSAYVIDVFPINYHIFLVKNRNYDLWLNTTHIHRNSHSSSAVYSLLCSLIVRLELGSLYIVIHGGDDREWISRYRRGFASISDSLNIIEVLLALDMVRSSDHGAVPHSNMQAILYPYLHVHSSSLLRGSCKKLYSSSPPLRLCIFGNNIESHRFSELSAFSELIEAGAVEITYCGCSFKGSIQTSGIKEAVASGHLSDIVSGKARIPDVVAHAHLQQCDAILDMNITDDANYANRSSGKLGLSLSLMKPVIVHTDNFRSFPCMRYNSYSDLTRWISRSCESFWRELDELTMILAHKRHEAIILNKSLFSRSVLERTAEQPQWKVNCT
jgi:hypothetical protein